MSKDFKSYSQSYGYTIFMICSVLLFLGAIAIFIWILIDAAEQHFVKNILYAAAFLIITFGVLIFSLCAYKSPRTSAVIMWVTIGLGAASFITGLCINDSKQNIEISKKPVPLPPASESLPSTLKL